MRVNIRKPCKSLPTAMVGTRSRGSRRRLSDHDIRCSASERRWFPARPAQHVHRRRNNGKGQIQSALASAHGRNGERRGETCSAGRAGAYRPSEALHPTRSSDVLPRIARERVPTIGETLYLIFTRIGGRRTRSSRTDQSMLVARALKIGQIANGGMPPTYETMQ